MTRPEIRHKRMRVGDLPPAMRRWVDRGDPDEAIDVYEEASDPIFQRIPRLTADEDGGTMTRSDIEGMVERGQAIIDAAGYPRDWWTVSDQGFSLSALHRGGDGRWYGIRRCVGPDDLYTYETVPLGDGSDLDALSRITGIAAARLRKGMAR